MKILNMFMFHGLDILRLFQLCLQSGALKKGASYIHIRILIPRCRETSD